MMSKGSSLPTGLLGTAARALLARGVSPRTMERVFDPIVADLHAEWGEAASARWALVAYARAHAAMLRAACTLLAMRLTRAIGRSARRFGIHIALAASPIFALFFVLARVSSLDANMPPPRPDSVFADFVRSPLEQPNPDVAS
jgi:hypothetical protein